MPDTLGARMAHLEGAFQQMDKRLGSIEGRIDSLGRDLQGFRLEVRADMREQFRWMLGLMVTAILSPAIVRLFLR